MFLWLYLLTGVAIAGLVFASLRAAMKKSRLRKRRPAPSLVTAPPPGTDAF